MTRPVRIAPADIRVLHRDEQLIVVAKPPGIPTTSPTGHDCLVELVRSIDPRAPHLHASSRLDAEVSGAVTFARTTVAIRALLAARRAGTYRRLYLAIALVAPSPTSGSWTQAIAIDPQDARRRIAVGPSQRAARAQAAETDYAVRAAATPTSAVLLELRPRTGRTHQLRVHSAAAGAPLLGDTHYGGARRATLANGRVITAARVMLHCASVTLPRIGAPGTLHVQAPIPDDFRTTWLALGGNVTDL